MTDCTWPRYESHKIVQAATIVGVARDEDDGYVIWVRPDPEGEMERFEPSIHAMAQTAEPGAYAMVYPDGFRSISPKKAFDEGYRKVSA